MKERITYIHGAGDAFEPSQLQVEKTSLVVKNLQAAREDRLTFDIDELPHEVYDQLLGDTSANARQDQIDSEPAGRLSPSLEFSNVLSTCKPIPFAYIPWSPYLPNTKAKR